MLRYISFQLAQYVPFTYLKNQILWIEGWKNDWLLFPNFMHQRSVDCLLYKTDRSCIIDSKEGSEGCGCINKGCCMCNKEKNKLNGIIKLEYKWTTVDWLFFISQWDGSVRVLSPEPSWKSLIQCNMLAWMYILKPKERIRFKMLHRINLLNSKWYKKSKPIFDKTAIPKKSNNDGYFLN